MSTLLREEFAETNRQFMEYIVLFRKEIQEYSQRNNANVFYIQKQNKKLLKLKAIKDRYANIMDNLLLLLEDSYYRGEQAGIAHANRERKEQEMPWSKDGKNREIHRTHHNSSQKEKWADHF